MLWKKTIVSATLVPSSFSMASGGINLPPLKPWN
nr:MAG TPA: hypothetical protein [Caudoviricetes sp.]